ncbi:hypothetical protein EG68_11571, partial [Paragonimus skrjabini miyazakii]
RRAVVSSAPFSFVTIAGNPCFGRTLFHSVSTLPQGWSTIITDNQSSGCCPVCSLFECVPSLKVPLCVSAREQSTVNLYLLWALHLCMLHCVTHYAAVLAPLLFSIVSVVCMSYWVFGARLFLLSPFTVLSREPSLRKNAVLGVCTLLKVGLRV